MPQGVAASEGSPGFRPTRPVHAADRTSASRTSCAFEKGDWPPLDELSFWSAFRGDGIARDCSGVLVNCRTPSRQRLQECQLVVSDFRAHPDTRKICSCSEDYGLPMSANTFYIARPGIMVFRIHFEKNLTALLRTLQRVLNKWAILP